MQGLAEKLKDLLSKVQEHKGLHNDAIVEVSEMADALFHAAVSIEQAWSGSNFGYHWDLYYGDFQKPPLRETFSVEWGGIHGFSQNWKSRTPDEVKARIEELANDRVLVMQEKFEALLASARNLQMELLVELAPLHRVGGLKKEQELLQELERFDWKDNQDSQFLADALNSLPRMTRDSQAFMQGRRIPSHMHYQSLASRAIRGCQAIEQFWRLSERLLKQLELQKDALRVERKEEKIPTGIERRYERLLQINLGAAAVLLAFVFALSTEFFLRRYHWGWLLQHPHSTSIRLLFYVTSMFVLLGLFVPRLRNWCWGGAATSALIALVQSAGR